MLLTRTAQIAELQWETYCKLQPTVKEDFGEQLPKDLRVALIEVDDLIIATGGKLRSRQEVAGIIVMWVSTYWARPPSEMPGVAS